MKRCPNCNFKINKKAKFCPECGEIVVTEELNSKMANNKSKIAIIVLSILLLISLVITCHYWSIFALRNTDESNGYFSNNPNKISEAAKSVVKLNCYDENGLLIATGSGFSAFEEGVIVTNYHVIEDCPARIEIETETGQKCDIWGGFGASIDRDVAILYYQPKNGFELPILEVASTEMLTKGEKVVAIGSPLGLTNVVSAGVFSGYTTVGDFTDIQFTASISSGSSGGALFNNNGYVIGITYASIEAGQNLNFAVPIEFVESLWNGVPAGAVSLNGFYDSIIPHYSVEYVLINYDKLTNATFYLDCWYSSYGYITEEGWVVFCGNGYEDIYSPNENKPEIRFAKDEERYSKSDLIKLVLSDFRSGSFFEYRVSIMYGKRGQEASIKCNGTGWSTSDKKPYVIKSNGY